MTTKIPVELSSTPGIVDGSNATAITIDSSERVGIGTTSPSAPLHIVGDGNTGQRVHVGTSSAHQIYLGNTGGVSSVGTLSNHNFQVITNGSSRAVVDTSGNVGIGTTSPSGNLHISGSGGGDGVHMILQNTGNAPAGVRMLSGHGNWEMVNSKTVADALEFIDDSAGVTRMLIDSSGNLLIGKTTTADTTTGVKIAANAVMVQSASGTGAHDMHDFFRGTEGSLARVGNIRTTGSATAYNTSSDYRLKENAKPIQNGLERLNQLKPVKFDWKGTDISSEGFIAHEAQEVFPDAVSGEKDGEDMQGMDYGRITPLLVKAIQEQQEQIEQLKTEIQTLKGE